MTPERNTIAVETTAGSVKVDLSLTDTPTSEPCKVCNGTRNAMQTVVFGARVHRVEINGVWQIWKRFEACYAPIAAEIREKITRAGMELPVCNVCQEDFFIPERDMYNK